MNLGEQIIFLFSALGAINGILLSLSFFFIRKYRTLQSLLLNTWLLALSLRAAKSVFLVFNPALPKIYLQIGLSACFFIGPALYYYIRSVQEKPAAVPKSWIRTWIALSAIIVITGLILPYQSHPWAWNRVITTLIYTQWGIYLLAAGLRLRPILGTSLKHPRALAIPERFLAFLYWSNILIYLAYLLAAFRLVRGAYICGPIFFSVIFYGLIVFYFYKTRYEAKALAEDGAPNRPERRRIPDSDAQTWQNRLETVIRDKQLYKDPNLKLGDLARAINISMHQLSQLLNDNLGKSFSTYINEYRVQEACRLIATQGHLSIEAIGYEVGYNSKSTFYTAFKKVQDTTPAGYKERMDNQSQGPDL